MPPTAVGLVLCSAPTPLVAELRGTLSVGMATEVRYSGREGRLWAAANERAMGNTSAVVRGRTDDRDDGAYRFFIEPQFHPGSGMGGRRADVDREPERVAPRSCGPRVT